MERASTEGISCVAVNGFVVPEAQLRTTDVSEKTLEYQGIEMGLDAPFLEFLLTEGFMALHELPLIWQKYLRRYWNDNLLLKRTLLVSGVDLIGLKSHKGT